MKINLELDQDEQILLTEAFESAIAECYFTEIEEEVKNNYYESVQSLIKKFGLDIKVEKVIAELIELNTNVDDDFDEEFEIDVDDD
jgi:hypothetical protein